MNCIPRRQIWEDNAAMIHKHNLEFDLGLHSYTLEMNQYGDQVNIQRINRHNRISNFLVERQMKNSENK